LLMPLLVAMLTSIVIPAYFWALNMEYRQRMDEQFRLAGPRFTTSSSLPGVNDTAALMREVDLRIAEFERRLPPIEYRRATDERLTQMQKAIDTNSLKLDKLIDLHSRGQ